MSKVSKLELAPKNYNHQVVEYLKEQLERAQSGEIVEFVMVAKLDDGSYENCWTGCKNLHELVGILERLKFLALRRMDT